MSFSFKEVLLQIEEEIAKSPTIKEAAKRLLIEAKSAYEYDENNYYGIVERIHRAIKLINELAE